MKELKSAKMRSLLKRGLRVARHVRLPREGAISNLFTAKLANGWYYQVDFVHDSRGNKPYSWSPHVCVYAFKPSNKQDSACADYFLMGSV